VVIIKKNRENYLDYIPVINSEINWETVDDNLVTLETSRKGIFDKMAQRFFKVPKTSYIKLDRHGSFIWKCIDGDKSVYEISKDVHKEFDKEAEPLIERLITFFSILNDNKFVTFKKGDFND
jgi:hypothetical protein